MNSSNLAWGLVAYGVVGLVLSIVGFTFGLDAAGQIERLAAASDATLEAAARSTAAAADSFESIDGSLVNAEDSIAQAAILSADAGATLDALSAAMNLSIFGAQPLQPLADEFADAAEQAEALATTLGTTGRVGLRRSGRCGRHRRRAGCPRRRARGAAGDGAGQPDPDPWHGRAAAGVPHAARGRGAGGGLPDAACPASGARGAAGVIGQSADRMIRRRRRSDPR